MAQELDKKLKQIEDALKRLNSLGGDTTFFNTNNITNLETAEKLLRSIENDINGIDISAKSTYNSFAGIIVELTKGKSTTQEIVKGTRDLFNISRNLYNSTEGIYNVSVKQAKKEIEKAKIQFSNLKLVKEQSELEDSQLTNLNGILGLESIFLQQLSESVREAQAIENSLGATGAILDTFTNLPGLKQFSSYFKLNEVKEEMVDLSREILNGIKAGEGFKEQYDEQAKTIRKNSDLITNANIELEKGNLSANERKIIEENISSLKKEQEEAQAKIGILNANAAEQAGNFANRTKIALKGITSAISNMAKGLTDPLALFTMLVKAAGSVNEQVVNLQKSLNLSYNEALEVRKEMGDMANASAETFINVAKIAEAQAQFNEALGLQGKLNLENSVTFAEITKRLGASVESAAKLQLFAEATGTSFKEQKLASYEIAQSVSSQYGVQLNIKQVMDEVGKAGAYALAQNQGSVEALTESVAKAKALGITLQDVNSIAGKLLDFESSITSELQAELLIGRDINLEKARLAALNNDQVTLMEEINSQMGDFNDFSNMNRIQQEAFAESLGMSVNQMSDMLLLEQYRNKNFKEIAAEAGEDVAKRVEALSTQERFNDAILKMQDMLVNLVDGPLGTFANLISGILSSSIGVYGIMGALAAGPIVKLLKMFKTMKKLSIASAVANIFSGNAKFGPLGIAMAGLGVGALLGTIASASKGDDVLSKSRGKSGYGDRMLLGPEGAISLNNKDTVIAGTDLYKGNDIISAGVGQINMPPQDSRTGEKTNMLLEQILSKQGTIKLDSTDMGTAMSVNRYAIQ
jgi:hypothetical protein